MMRMPLRSRFRTLVRQYSRAYPSAKSPTVNLSLVEGDNAKASARPGLQETWITSDPALVLLA